MLVTIFTVCISSVLSNSRIMAIAALTLIVGCGDEPPPFVNKDLGQALGNIASSQDADGVLEEGRDPSETNDDFSELDDVTSYDKINSDDLNEGDSSSNSNGKGDDISSEDIQMCQDYLDSDSFRHVSGRENQVGLDGSSTSLLKVTGNMNAVTYEIESMNLGEPSSLCVIVTGNQSQVDLKLSQGALDSLVVILKGNLTSVTVEVSETAELVEFVEDIRGNASEVTFL